MKKILFILLSFGLAAEMEVDGDLKVTGTVDASGNPITNVGAALSMTDAINGNVLQSALRDDGVYEYLAYKVKIYTSNTDAEMAWILLSAGSTGWGADFISELNTRSLEGYSLHSTMTLPWFYAQSEGGNYPDWGASSTSDVAYILFMLKRQISDD